VAKDKSKYKCEYTLRGYEKHTALNHTELQL